jgi:hypothetical protein
MANRCKAAADSAVNCQPIPFVILTTEGRKDLTTDLSLRFFLPLVVRMTWEGEMLGIRAG